MLARRTGLPGPPGERPRCTGGAVLPGRSGGGALAIRRSPWSAPGARPGTGSAWRRSSGPTWPRSASAWSRASPSGSTGRPTKGPRPPGAPPIAVVAGGLDDPYPRRNARLWARVAEQGAVYSESPAGVRTEKWRFPVRNRLLAMLSDVVVVVESRHRGGALYTVEAAAARGIPVGAVPGSIRSPTSEGTNRLLADGCFPVCGVDDILDRARPARRLAAGRGRCRRRRRRRELRCSRRRRVQRPRSGPFRGALLRPGLPRPSGPGDRVGAPGPVRRARATGPRRGGPRRRRVVGEDE